MAVLVTGGAGFVGSHCVELLLSEGHKVVVVDNFNSESSTSKEKFENGEYLKMKAVEFASKGASVSVHTCDCMDKDRLKTIIQTENVSKCLHVAAMAYDRRSVFYASDYMINNTVGTTKLFEALQECGVKTVVSTSTRSAFGQRDDNDDVLNELSRRLPVNPYGASKVGSDAIAHQFAHNYDMDVTLLRLFSVYGPRGRPDMMPRMLTERIHSDVPIRKFGGGHATRCWIYAGDVARAFWLAMNNKPVGGYAEYNLGTPVTHTLDEIIELAEDVVGKKAIIDQVGQQPGDAVKVAHSDFSLVTQELGWEPRVTLREGLRLTYDYWLARPSPLYVFWFDQPQRVLNVEEAVRLDEAAKLTTLGWKLDLPASSKMLLADDEDSDSTCDGESFGFSSDC